MSYIVTIDGNTEDQEKTLDLVDFLCRQHGMSKPDADVFSIAVGEAYDNGLLYSPDRHSILKLIFHSTKIEAEISNKGKKIEFDNIEKFDTSQDFMKYKDGKLGIPMIKALVDDVKFFHKSGHNFLTLTKHKNLNKTT